MLGFRLSEASRALGAKAKIPTELAAIAAVFCIGGGFVLLYVALNAVLLPRHLHPDKGAQILYTDPSVRPLLIYAAIGMFVFGLTAIAAGGMVFARAKRAGLVLRAAMALAAAAVVAGVVFEERLHVPALRKLALTLKWPEALFYDPRLYRWGAPAMGVVMLAVLFGMARALRRPHVRAALAGDRPAV